MYFFSQHSSVSDILVFLIYSFIHLLDGLLLADNKLQENRDICVFNAVLTISRIMQELDECLLMEWMVIKINQPCSLHELIECLHVYSNVLNVFGDGEIKIGVSSQIKR